MISRCEWEREGCDNWEVMSGLKGQGRCWFGCDVVYQGESWSMMQSGGVAAGLCYTALIPLRDRPVKAGSDLWPTHIAAQLEWT